MGKMTEHIEYMEPIGWAVPKHWAFGICQKEMGGCGNKFDPKLPKQFLCWNCRQPEYQIKSDPINKGPISRALYELKGDTICSAARKIGVSESAMRRWNEGLTPVSHILPRKLCDYLKMTYEELFDPEAAKFLRASEDEHIGFFEYFQRKPGIKGLQKQLLKQKEAKESQ